MTPPIRLDRRNLLGAAGLGLLATSLSACGSEKASSPSGAPTADSAFPVKITHKYGTTTVPSAPKRVVSVGLTEQDTLLALGVIPVGVTEWYGDQPYATWPWAQDALGGGKPKVLHTDNGFELEKIVGLRPDLIVGTNAGLEEKDYKLLSAIAPTVAQSGKFTDYFEPWTSQSTAIGTALGKRTEIDKVIGDVGDEFAAALKANPSFQGTKVIFLQNAVYDGSVIAYQKGLSTEFLTSLGMEVPEGLEKFAKEGQAYIPLEQLDVLDSADVLIWATETDKDKTNLEKVPGFKELKAVAAGRSVYTGGELAGAIYFTSPLSLPYVVDKLTPMLADVL